MHRLIREINDHFVLIDLSLLKACQFLLARREHFIWVKLIGS